MAEWLSAEHVEEASAAGRQEITISRCAKVTPLATERAAELGVAIVVEPGAEGAPKTVGPGVDGLERRIREVTQRALLNAGMDPSNSEEVLAAVLARLRSDKGGACGCK